MRLLEPAPETSTPGHRYTPRCLLTPTEAQFHACLESISGARCRIVCKPRLADFIQHHSGIGSFAKISQRHVDFLICRTEDWMPMVGIELDQHLPDQPMRSHRNEVVAALFAKVGIPLLQIHVSELFEVEKLTGKLSMAWQRRALGLTSALPARRTQLPVARPA